MRLTITYIGGPTALLEFGGVRLLHFSEGAKEIAAAFELAGMSDRLLWGEAGNAVAIEL